MRIGNKLGRVGWKIACESLKLREYTKASLVGLNNRNPKRHRSKGKIGSGKEKYR